MRTRTTALLTAIVLGMTACGSGEPMITLPTDPDAPFIQVRSEGGFAPVEWIIGRGPSYTLLADGRLIFEGPVIEIYPGPLVVPYQEVRPSSADVNRLLDLVDAIGLPGMTEERDDTQAGFIADATTEVITFWDEMGTHTYSVYALGALGVEPASANPRTEAFFELWTLLGELVFSGESAIYRSDRIRVLAGIGEGEPDPEFVDVRPWPLSDGPDRWEATGVFDWKCKVYGPEVLEVFTDATQTTQWELPQGSENSALYTLLVRQLLPGEPDCPLP